MIIYRLALIRLSLKQLDDASTRKLQQFERWDRDHADAVRWLRANQNKFEKEIFEPPILSVSIPDKRYADAVESFFNQNTMKVGVAGNCRTLLTYVCVDICHADSARL